MVLNTSFNENEPVVLQPAGSIGLLPEDKDGPAGHGKHSPLETRRRLSTWTLDHLSVPPTVYPSIHRTT